MVISWGNRPLENAQKRPDCQNLFTSLKAYIIIVIIQKMRSKIGIGDWDYKLRKGDWCLGLGFESGIEIWD